MTKTLVALPFGVVLALVGIAACGEQTQDAPVDHRQNTPGVIINMPDGFSNIARNCDGTTAVYSIYHSSSYGAVAAVNNSEQCGYRAPQPQSTP